MTKAQGEEFGKLGNDVFLMIESFPIPVIAAVNGFVWAAGNELAMSCDIRLALTMLCLASRSGSGHYPRALAAPSVSGARLVGMGMANSWSTCPEHQGRRGIGSGKCCIRRRS